MKAPRNLVFTSVGEENAIGTWCRTKRSYSLALAYFGDIPTDRLRNYADYYLLSKGYKFFNFLKCIDIYPNILNHDYFLFIDDDIVIDPKALEKIFALCHSYRLDACQPALINGSVFKWSHLEQDTNKLLEYTNLVEIQCFCVSKLLLTLLLPLLPLVKTGWGLDLVFWQLLNYQTDKMAILHSIGMLHPKRKGKKVSETLENFDQISRQVEIDLSLALSGSGQPLFEGFKVQSFGAIFQGNVQVSSNSIGYPV